MANHPYNQHREQQVAHRRVGHILKGSPAGATKHADSNAFSKVTSKSAAERHDDIAGSPSASRFARGGKVKGQTNISIIVPQGGDKPPLGAPAGPALPLPPPGAGPGLPPPMPPGMPPGLPPGGPPGMMKARGGSAGTATKANIDTWSKRAAKNSYFRGGAATGVGREEKAARAKRK